jgi:hypothetical protein
MVGAADRDYAVAVAAASMRAAVRRLSFGAAEERREAAGEVAALARSDERRKRLLPELGVVPPLVAMLADARGGAGARLAAAGALLELARGTHRSVARCLLAVFACVVFFDSARARVRCQIHLSLTITHSYADQVRSNL